VVQRDVGAPGERDQDGAESEDGHHVPGVPRQQVDQHGSDAGGAALLGGPQLEAARAIRSAGGESGPELSRMQAAHSGAVVPGMGVDAVGIQQGVAEQLEHGTLAVR
jgi:hypothetical protein